MNGARGYFLRRRPTITRAPTPAASGAASLRPLVATGASSRQALSHRGATIRTGPAAPGLGKPFKPILMPAVASLNFRPPHRGGTRLRVSPPLIQPPITIYPPLVIWDPHASVKSRQHERVVADIMNALILSGQLQLTGQNTWGIGYKPTLITNWVSPAPTTLQAALDRIAAALAALGQKP